jgi:hypothetical protein
MIDPTTRLQGVEQLIEQGQYFIIHAPYQSGKTTYLKDLTNRLNAGGKYYALYCSLDVATDFVEAEKGIPAIIQTLKDHIKYSTLPSKDEFARNIDYDDYNNALHDALADYCILIDKPLVILFGEVEGLSVDTRMFFLAQLRDGYNCRSMTSFVHSIALVGIRDIRHYKVKARPDDGTRVPFNIVAGVFTLQNFTREEVVQLYQQHTDATGQVFEDDAVQLIWEQTQGQPWLVNAIANEIICGILQSDYTKSITSGMVGEAIKTVIQSRDSHIRYIQDIIEEESVRSVIEQIITGGDTFNITTDARECVLDLGLIRKVPQFEPANPIYAEVIVRTLIFNLQYKFQHIESPYKIARYMKDERIDMDYLMRDFQELWREDGAIREEEFGNTESAPFLIIMAFLQCVFSGGQIIRNMKTNTGCLDLCIIYERQKYPIELKLRKSPKYLLQESLEQTADYVDTLGCAEGWLAIFDRRQDIGWDDKIFMQKEKINGKTVTTVGL